MNNEKILLTVDGLKKLQTEISYLINVRQPEIIQQIQEAREQGDLSENADYDASKNEQAVVAARIKEIQMILENYELIDENKAKNNNVVSVGRFVEIFDFNEETLFTYQIVGTTETNPFENKISNDSPLGKVLIDKKVGDKFEVKGVGKSYTVEIRRIW